MDGGELVVRADAGPGTGVGHLARCLALTQAWIDWGGRVTLMAASPPKRWADRYRAEGAMVVEPSRGFGVGADWAVLDGYRFGPEDEVRARKAALRLLVIDDHGSGGDHGADLVVDQNLGATADSYQGEVLVGTRYALLRRDFWRWRQWTRDIPDRAREVLVTLGGSPPDEVTSLVQAAVAELSRDGLNTTVLENVEDVASAMASADIAVSASGSTCWELCCLGLPAVLLPIAPNQEPLAAALHLSGVAEDAGRPSTITATALATTALNLARDPRRRSEMARRGRQLVDGRGARRVVTRMRSQLLELRPIGEGDARLLWDWANDSVVRASGFHPEPIGWETHIRWVQHCLTDPNTYLYLASDAAGTALGQVRFQGDDTAAEIGISVARSFRGLGWGAAVIDAGVRRLFNDSAVARVLARIKTENEASRLAFEDASFFLWGDGAGDSDVGSLRYVRPRSIND
jgi:UDP-2,4-diacetamido-2,4,6-trideoxy-beta-L-altropyranose hydrolase